MGYIKHKSEESVEDYLETILVLSRRLADCLLYTSRCV